LEQSKPPGPAGVNGKKLSVPLPGLQPALQAPGLLTFVVRFALSHGVAVAGSASRYCRAFSLIRLR